MILCWTQLFNVHFYLERDIFGPDCGLAHMRCPAQCEPEFIHEEPDDIEGRDIVSETALALCAEILSNCRTTCLQVIRQVVCGPGFFISHWLAGEAPLHSFHVNMAAVKRHRQPVCKTKTNFKSGLLL